MAVTRLGLLGLPTSAGLTATPAGPNDAPTAPVITSPITGVTYIDASATIVFTAGVDPEGGSVTHYREHRAAGSSGTWTRSGAVISGHTWHPADGSYEYRIVASDGVNETASASQEITFATTPVSANLTINGYAVDSYFVLGSPGGLENGPFREWNEAQLYDSFGVRVNGVRVIGTRLTLNGSIVGNSVAARQSQLRKLKWIIEHQQPAVLVFGDEPTKRITARHQGTRVLMPPRGSFVDRFRSIESEWLLELPYHEDVTETAVTGISTTPVDLPQGTGPTRPTIEIAGPATDPVLTLRDSAGVTIETLGLTCTLAGSGNVRTIDMELRTIVDETGASKLSELTSGDFFEVLSEHFVYDDSAGVWPTLACSSGTAVATYRKAWL